MEKVKTATGKQFDCDYFNPSVPLRKVHIQVYNVPLHEVAMVFNDPSETAQLCYIDQCLNNYTRLIALRPEGSGVRIVLGKE